MTRRSSPALFAGALLFASTVSAPVSPMPDQVATPFATSGGWNIYRYEGECSMMSRLQRGNRLEITWPSDADMIGIHMHAPEMEGIEDSARYDLELYFHLRPGEGEAIRASFMGSYSDELSDEPFPASGCRTASAPRNQYWPVSRNRQRRPFPLPAGRHRGGLGRIRSMPRGRG